MAKRASVLPGQVERTRRKLEQVIGTIQLCGTWPATAAQKREATWLHGWAVMRVGEKPSERMRRRQRDAEVRAFKATQAQQRGQQ